ncbi:MAG: hypothetical protein FRX48_06276 [Lasallia pustulata]|uniref:LicD/FKTN/FKRP nucleotidyltransferase domain-containing protein n=1 Tax=Lasallia pustulata TaxID=136370 RepID=A0A5M8PME5_9LECA|nr:MAG: hypothetical protein FRX48_06276 [Lasallia pustulata]
MKLRGPLLAVACTWTLVPLGGAVPVPQLDGAEEAEAIANRKKYFHEPGTNDVLGHYDTRFFDGAVSYEEKGNTQYHMIRAYLSTFQDLGLETWIAHGTLLGWWWNSQILPWDWDIDTQVSGATLEYMARNLNRTTHRYTSQEHGVSRHYLLDVNPAAVERERGDGYNIIDARWIDVRNGLYIDITGLSETHPDLQPGTLSCKNYHRYRTTELFPLRESIFEGVLAKIPYAYDTILTDEYSVEALVTVDFHGHRWDPTMKQWIKYKEMEDEEHSNIPGATVPSGSARSRRSESSLSHESDASLL